MYRPATVSLEDITINMSLSCVVDVDDEDVDVVAVGDEKVDKASTSDTEMVTSATF